MAKKRLVKKIIHVKRAGSGKYPTPEKLKKMCVERLALLENLAIQIVAKFPEVKRLDVIIQGILVELPNQKRLMRAIEKKFNCDLLDFKWSARLKKPESSRRFRIEPWI